MKKILVFLICLFGNYCCVQAEIVESSDIKVIIPQIESKTLVIFDLDNTIMQPKQVLGSDQWFSQYYRRYMDEGIHQTYALSKTLDVYHKVQHKTEMKIVDTQTLKIIEQIKSRGLPIVAITARGEELADITLHQLQSLGVSFKSDYLLYEEMHLGPKGEILARDGVVFMSGRNKGSVLKDLLDKTQIEPNKIIFIDDKQACVESLEHASLSLGIPFWGLRYAFMDEQVKDFDLRVADLQLQVFNSILNNEQASSLLEAYVDK